MHPPVPFATQHGAGLQLCITLTHVQCALPGLLGRPRAVQQAYGFGVQVAQLLGLKPVGHDTKQEMAGQVRGRLPPEHGAPSTAKLSDAEIAHTRNLGVE